MKCAYCSVDLPRQLDRPVRIEAICWPCWYDMYGRKQAVADWKQEHWWRRLTP